MTRLTRGLVLVVLVALAACAPGALPPFASDGPPRHAWLPPDEPRAVILAVHGFNDYGNAFAWFGEHAAEHGIAVYAYDQPGFGDHAGRGHWPGVAVLTAELRRELSYVRGRHPDAPVYLLGVSMGAAVIAAAAGERPLPVAGTMLAAPALWGGDLLPGLYRATLYVVAAVAPWIELTGGGLDIMPSDNLAMLRAYSADPLVLKGTNVAALKGLVELMDTAVVATPRLKGPLLMLTGARDEIVPPEATAAIRARLTARDCAVVDYPDGYHMLLRDLQRKVVWADVLAWIDGARTLPSGLAQSCGTDG